jgi:hypothetical protein
MEFRVSAFCAFILNIRPVHNGKQHVEAVTFPLDIKPLLGMRFTDGKEVRQQQRSLAKERLNFL